MARDSTTRCSIAGAYARVRVSAQEDNEVCAALRRPGARASFGVNGLLTPARLPRLEDEVIGAALPRCADPCLQRGGPGAAPAAGDVE